MFGIGGLDRLRAGTPRGRAESEEAGLPQMRGRTFRFVPDALDWVEQSEAVIRRQDGGDGPEGPTPYSSRADGLNQRKRGSRDWDVPDN